VELDEIVCAFADAIVVVDRRSDRYITRSEREYRPGIGPYPDNRAMELVASQLTESGIVKCRQSIAYPSASRQKCDLGLGDPIGWGMEVKMGRFRGDNGKPDDTGIKDLISPLRSDRSALIDGLKLAESGFDKAAATDPYVRLATGSSTHSHRRRSW